MSAAYDLLRALVLEDGRRWGEVAAPFQRDDAKAILDVCGVPFHFLTRARGGSKTGDLAGIALAAMLTQLPPRSRCYALAADQGQGRLLLDSIEGFGARTAELGGALDVGAFRVTATRTGTTLDVLAADAPGAWGTRPAFVICDELGQWATTPNARRLWEATSSAVAKVRDARMVVLTTAADPVHWSYRVLDHARRDVLWRVHEVEGPPPWLSADRLAEQRRRLSPAMYERLFENRWRAAEDRVATRDDVESALSLDGPLPPQPGVRYVVALDLGLKRDHTVASVCHGEPVRHDDRFLGARVVCDRQEVWSGTQENPVQLSDVEAWVEQAARAYNHAPLVVDPWQAAGLVQRLRRRGIQCDEFNFSTANVGRLASTLLQLLRNHMLDLPRDDDLFDELVNLRLRETTPGVVRLDHDPDRRDDRAVSLALAAYTLLERGRFGPVAQATVGYDASEFVLEPTTNWVPVEVREAFGPLLSADDF